MLARIVICGPSRSCGPGPGMWFSQYAWESVATAISSTPLVEHGLPRFALAVAGKPFGSFRVRACPTERRPVEILQRLVQHGPCTAVVTRPQRLRETPLRGREIAGL